VQWVWVLPLVAAIIGGWLAVRAVMSHGPTITIRFKTAEGLEAGKTRVKYKDVDIGVVKTISLAEDRAGIVVSASLSKSAEDLLVEDTRFWVVRARIAGGSVSGIGTLLSGSYIGMDPGTSKESRRDFEGLETPPVITSGLEGKQFVLRGEDIGSLDVGSPVYYRRLEAGRVVAYELDKEGKGVVVHIFVNAPYDGYVTANTRFWHASGIDVALDANGLKINTETLASIVVGGIAFLTPEGSNGQAPVAANTTFTLFSDRVQAMKQPVTRAERYAMRFRDSVRGLAVGAPLDFRGITVGEVKSIDVEFDRVKRELSMVVEVDFWPERLFRSRRVSTPVPEGGPSLVRLIDRGLRAQLRSANLLTGQLFVALDFFPGTRKANMDATRVPPEIPTMPGTSQELQTTITSIARKLERIPFDEISSDLRRTLQSASTALDRFDKEITPQAHDTLVEARQGLTEARQAVVEARKALASVERTLANAEGVPADASDAMREIGRAAESFRVLADYLERHPESLIRGKKEDAR
jgi:paraquat-inducible protein B